MKASILSVKALYPGKKLTVAFQPHLYSRTRDFAPEFAEALSLADEVILLDKYAIFTISGRLSQMSPAPAVNNISKLRFLIVSVKSRLSMMVSFLGPKRRFEFWLKEDDPVRAIIDDYAHHPDELKASILL